jgi:hypothetical protein
MIIEERDHWSETVTRMRDHEIEVARDSARSQHDKRHAAHEHWFEAEIA